eukprot:5731478-Pleurochrysis_carterae.AAC.3
MAVGSCDAQRQRRLRVAKDSFDKEYEEALGAKEADYDEEISSSIPDGRKAAQWSESRTDFSEFMLWTAMDGGALECHIKKVSNQGLFA